MKHLVYRTTHIPTSKFYIGVHSTEDINDGYMGSGILIRRLVESRPSKEFVKEILHEFNTREEAYQKEQELVSQTTLDDDLCLNLSIGGNGGWDYVNNTYLTKSIRSERTIGCRNPMYGKRHSEESISLMSQNRRGINTGPQTKQHIENKRMTKCKSYVVTTPNGDEMQVSDLVRFCEQYDLTYKTMSKLPNNKRHPKRGKCAGWRCRFSD